MCVLVKNYDCSFLNDSQQVPFPTKREIESEAILWSSFCIFLKVLTIHGMLEASSFQYILFWKQLLFFKRSFKTLFKEKWLFM